LNTNFKNEFDMSENEEKATGFLKVLCILTIIGSALSIFGSLFQKEDAVVEAYGWYYWVMLLLAVGTLYGALQMMKLKKMGLYIYTVCEVLSIVLPWMIVKTVIDEAASVTGGVEGQIMTEAADTIANITMVVMSIVPAAFLIMYWTNAKKLS
tara:strand:- start:991 stop:1449 length:459 start_codon:yes stop_codon:yes gene_type:complete